MSHSFQPDPYVVLGVEPSATAEQITHAYRALLRRHHPDTRPTADEHGNAPAEDAARLQQILHAYAVLHDPHRRARYDRSRHPSPPPHPEQRHEQRRTSPATTPPPGAVVIGTLEQPRPAWITPLDTTPTLATDPAPSQLLKLVRDLFDRPR
jgi:curved DNA-binding protein CbpA